MVKKNRFCPESRLSFNEPPQNVFGRLLFCSKLKKKNNVTDWHQTRAVVQVHTIGTPNNNKNIADVLQSYKNPTTKNHLKTKDQTFPIQIEWIFIHRLVAPTFCPFIKLCVSLVSYIIQVPACITLQLRFFFT